MSTNAQTTDASQAQRTVPWWAYAAMIGSAACWGFATVMSRGLLDTFTPPALLVVQLVASVVFLVLLAIPEKPTRYLDRRLAKASSVGVLEPGLTYILGLAGLALTTASNSSVISATEPLLIVVLAWLLLRQRVSRRRLMAILAAGIGIVLVSAPNPGGDYGGQQFVGDGLVLVSTLFAAAYVVVSSRFTDSIPAATLAAAQQVVGLVLAVVFLAGTHLLGFYQQDWALVTPEMLAFAASSGVVQYALAFWLYLIGLKHLAPSAAGLWLAFTPVFGILGGFLWLGEMPSLLMLLGTVVILGALISTRKDTT
ncbi:MAG: DMT family transporter [Microbacterium sp.]